MKRNCKNQSKITRLTFDQYDNVLEQFDNIDVITIYPTLRQIDLFEENPRKWIITCCYMYEKGVPPVSKDEEYRRKTLGQFINKYLELYETKEEIAEAEKAEAKESEYA